MVHSVVVAAESNDAREGPAELLSPSPSGRPKEQPEEESYESWQARLLLRPAASPLLTRGAAIQARFPSALDKWDELAVLLEGKRLVLFSDYDGAPGRLGALRLGALGPCRLLISHTLNEWAAQAR